MEGTDDKNCCCFCFDARTGVMIIGILLWIGVLGCAFQGFWFAAAVFNSDGVFYYWYIIPAVIINLYLAILFVKVMQNENKENDHETRTKFARAYLVFGVFVNGAAQLCCMVLGWIQFSIWCNAQDYGPYYNCGTYIASYQYSFWVNFVWTVLLQLYFAHVCKLFANLIDPQNPHTVQHMPDGQQVTYAADGTAYQQPPPQPQMAYQAPAQQSAYAYQPAPQAPVDPNNPYKQ